MRQCNTEIDNVQYFHSMENNRIAKKACRCYAVKWMIQGDKCMKKEIMKAGKGI